MATISAQEFLRGGKKPVLVRPVEATFEEIVPQSNVGSRIKDDFSQRKENIGNILQDESKSTVRRGVEATAEGFGAISATAKNVLPEPAREGIDKVGNLISVGFKKLTDKIGSSKQLQDWVLDNPEAARRLEDVLGTTSAAGAIAGEILGVEGGVRVGTKTVNKTTQIVEDLNLKVPSLKGVPNLSEKVTEFLAKDIDGGTQTILKETSGPMFDKYVRYAREAADDPRALTPFDRVGDRMEEATRMLRAKMKGVGAEKSEYTQPLRQGFDSFSAKSLVDDLTSLHNRLPVADRAFVKKFVEKAKEVKTKYSADKLIDEIQDAVRTAGAQNIIPKGSALQKQVSGIVEKFNNALKEAVGPEYAKLNTQYSSLKNATNALNKALGEVVEGQSVRGGSLIKQFFSPSGKKAKVLFDYVKKRTGIDLAQESTLSRFAMELFDDPRARSLLEGIPATPRGFIEKGLDVMVERTGVGRRVRESVRQGEVRKARRLTK